MDTDDALFARDIAEQAGHLLLRIRAGDTEPSALGDAGMSASVIASSEMRPVSGTSNWVRIAPASAKPAITQ